MVDKMTKSYEEQLAEAAEKYAYDAYTIPFEQADLEYSFKAGAAFEQARSKVLLDALENWLEFEEDSIKTHGEYCGTRINEAIKMAKSALKQYKGE